jgi:hypothetical protein
MRFVLVSLVLIYSLVLSGCISKVENIFTYTKRATPQNMTVGRIKRDAPIIKEPKKEANVKKKVRYENLNDKYQKGFEMVGYIVAIYKDPEFRDLYLYTFTDALKTEKIQFYSKKRLNYRSNVLIRVYIKDNFLIKAQRYRSVIGKRKRSLIDSAKEYFIRF